MRFEMPRVSFMCVRLHVLMIAAFSLIANGMNVYPDLDSRRQFLMDRHLLLRAKGDLSRPIVERRSIEPQLIDLDVNEVGEVADIGPANVRVHSLFGRTLPLRTENAPFHAKIFRLGGTYPFKARSFNDGNYGDAMKKILLRMN
ncbi:hypothetical protein M3Y99_00827200 [Aphelenchoides fujianensis]|nr:hypothetical protein M3Y99_00947500 [Aphelenchoides fujianensis]KAI6234196.1 hypothetical protein M3Y99_00827200 [Aphelenchoides fujianensis]